MRTHRLPITLALMLILAVPATEAATVSGSIQVSGTRVKTTGAKNEKIVVVYLEALGDAEHPAPPEAHALIDQANLVFVPHVLAIQKGTTVDFMNSDTTDHNVFCVDECCRLVQNIESKKPKFLDLGNFPGGQRASHTFTIPGEGVVLCKLHPEMSAYIVVVDTPHFCVAEIDDASQSATYSIENVPPGAYVLKTWHKKCEAPDQTITVAEDEDAEADIELQRKQRRKRQRK